MILCAEILEIEIEILFLRLLAKHLIINVGIVLVVALNNYLIDVWDAVQVKQQRILIIQLQYEIRTILGLVDLDHVLVHDTQQLAQQIALFGDLSELCTLVQQLE